MKLKAIAGLLKKYRQGRLFEHEGTQWVSLPGAMYQLYGLPRFTAEELLAVMEIPEKELEKITFEEGIAPEEFNLDEYDGTERMVQPAGIDYVIIEGTEAHTAFTSLGMLLYKPDWLAPLPKEYELYERETETGTTYLMAKDGFFPVGVILPLKLEETTISAAEQLLNGLRTAYKNQSQKRPEFDPETGEVVDEKLK